MYDDDVCGRGHFLLFKIWIITRVIVSPSFLSKLLNPLHIYRLPGRTFIYIFLKFVPADNSDLNVDDVQCMSIKGFLSSFSLPQYRQILMFR